MSRDGELRRSRPSRCSVPAPAPVSRQIYALRSICDELLAGHAGRGDAATKVLKCPIAVPTRNGRITVTSASFSVVVDTAGSPGEAKRPSTGKYPP